MTALPGYIWQGKSGNNPPGAFLNEALKIICVWNVCLLKKYKTEHTYHPTNYGKVARDIR